MRSKLERHLEKHHHVAVFSKIADNEEIYRGYVVGLSRNLVCMWLVTEWHHDGFIIIPIKYVTKVRYGKFEKTDHRILEAEGRLVDVVMPGWLKIGSYRSAMKSLRINHNNIIIESRLPSVEQFIVGKIDIINNKNAKFKAFDAAAKWISGFYTVPFKEITSVMFGDNYSSILRKYVTK